jgi:hypothetical protein
MRTLLIACNPQPLARALPPAEGSSHCDTVLRELNAAAPPPTAAR